MPTDNSFFESRQEQSFVKTEIVTRYFQAWARIIISGVSKFSDRRIAYLDLFSGPGKYVDGTESTLLKILKLAIDTPAISEHLVTIFNDIDRANAQSLTAAIENLPGIEKLRHPPIIRNDEVGEDVIQMIEKMQSIPTLLFADPWGYKGLSLRLINSVIKNWGCDCIFFFNYNRVNMGLTNPIVVDHMDALFGKSRADSLRTKLRNLSPFRREAAIVENVAQALREKGSKYVLPFSFESTRYRRTSHHLVFTSKSSVGNKVMKDIMAKMSTTADQGVPSFAYSHASPQQALPLELERPLDDLSDMLLREFAGKILTMSEIYEQHNIGKRYIAKNYKKALLALELSGKIKASPSITERQANTFGDRVRVTFPPNEPDHD